MAAAATPVPRGPASLRHSPALLVGGVVYAVLAAGLGRYSWPVEFVVRALKDIEVRGAAQVVAQAADILRRKHLQGGAHHVIDCR